MSKNGVRWVFTVAWLLFGALVFWTEFLAPVETQDLLRVVAVAWFAVFEGWAVGRPKPGDTLSEHVWAFYAGKPARIPLIVSWSLYFAVAAVNIPVDPDLHLGRLPVTVLVIALGLFGWLVPHFVFRGKGG